MASSDSRQSERESGPFWSILPGDCRESMRSLKPTSVQTCVTSPPYFRLRDYEHSGQIGTERNLLEYITNIRSVFSEVRRVLADDGTVWLNLGDTYDQHKSLIGVPWKVANRLSSDGWIVRSAVVWNKPDAQPESAPDRLTSSYEMVFLLAKSTAYYFDWRALAVPFKGTDAQRRRESEGAEESHVRSDQSKTHKSGNLAKNASKLYAAGVARPRDIWEIPVREPESDPWRRHGAMMPMRLAYKCIVAGSRRGDAVLDPFSGAGTTGLVALRQGRSFVGCEINPEFVQLSRDRIIADAPLLNTHAEAA